MTKWWTRRYWRDRIQDRLDVQDGMMAVVVEVDDRGQWWLVSPLNGALRVRLEPGTKLMVRWWRVT